MDKNYLKLLFIVCWYYNFIKEYTDEADITFKEEFILKIAILAEKFADDL